MARVEYEIITVQFGRKIAFRGAPLTGCLDGVSQNGVNKLGKFNATQL